MPRHDKSLFRAETEKNIATYPNECGNKIDSMKLKESERKRFEAAGPEERNYIDEFAAEIRSAMRKNAKATNLTRKTLTDLWRC